MKIFEKCLTDVDITIYDYHQKSRDEEVIERLKREIELKKTNYEEYHRVVAERKKMENERRKKNGRRKY